MDKSQMDPFSRYVRRRMREQHLSRRDVSARSGGKIGESYVGAIIKGKCTNVSIDKLKALARGLGVDEMELARIALGDGEQSSFAGSETEDRSLILVDMRKKAVMSADVAEIARLLVQLSPRERSGVSKFVRRLINERARQAKHRPKRQRQ